MYRSISSLGNAENKVPFVNTLLMTKYLHICTVLRKFKQSLGPGRILWEQVENSRELGIEPSGSMKYWETIQ
jgi:hypothetical protein